MAAPREADLGGYEVLDELGRGGMGRVLRARHRKTGAVRALKVIAGFVDPEALERLRREGEALARVGGDGVVPVHEAGVEKGRAFLVLGLMPGGSLRDRLREKKQLDWREACQLIATIARALQRCHAAGLVHRDLKPDNILFDEEDRPRVADFGCVRDLGAKTLTTTGETLGTLPYMAPEQLDGARPTPKVDVYALGVMLHELVAGQLPFDASGSPARLLREKLSPSRRRSALSGAPAALDALIDAAIAAAPAARPDAQALAAELDAILAGGGRRAPRSRRGLAALVAGAALVVGSVAWWVASASVPAPGPSPTKTGGPRARVTPARSDPPQPPVKTLAEVRQLFQTSRPASEIAPIASAALAATTPTEAERGSLAAAALDRVAHHLDNPELRTAGGLRATCGEALHALSIALAAGGRPDGMGRARLAWLLEQLNDAPGGFETIDEELLRLLADVLPPLGSVEVARAAGSLCETADRVRECRSPDLVHVALDAVVAVADEPKARYTRGRCLAHRVVQEGRRDLIEPALADLALARDPAAPSKNEAVYALGVSARLETVRGHLDRALALLTEPLAPDLQEALDSSPSNRALLAIERARVEVHSDPTRAVEFLLKAAQAMRADDARFAAELEELATRVVSIRSSAEREAVLRTFPEYF